MSAFERITQGSRITYYSLMFFIAYAFKGHVHVFAGRVKVVSHSSCRTSAIFKYICPLVSLLYSETKRYLYSWHYIYDSEGGQGFYITLKVPVTNAEGSKFCDIFSEQYFL